MPAAPIPAVFALCHVLAHRPLPELEITVHPTHSVAPHTTLTLVEGGGAAPSSLRILLVDDDPVQRDLMCAAFRYFGVLRLDAVSGGAAALVHLATHPCDLVVTDLRLPGMDGVEFLHRVIELGIGKVAVISAADSAILSTVENTLAERGANLVGLLAKPVSMPAVLGLLERCCKAVAAPPAPAPAMALPATCPRLLETALANDEFVPFYQPKIDLATGRLLGVEILARWRRPGVGTLPPAHFIPAMEDTPLIDTLTDQLLERALADAKAWRAGPVTIALNLAPRTLEDARLPDRLLALTRHYDIAPERIILELTETAMASKPALIRECAARLRLRGFKFAIDDFGIGYSSMALLLSLPFTELKIDRSFVARLAGSRKARTMLEAMIALGQRLDMDVVAEGVETEAELRLLRALGCPAAQGFYFAQPMAHHEFLAWLAQRAASTCDAIACH